MPLPPSVAGILGVAGPGWTPHPDVWLVCGLLASLYAIGGNEHSAVLMGLPVRSTLVGVQFAWALCLAAAALTYPWGGVPLSNSPPPPGGTLGVPPPLVRGGGPGGGTSSQISLSPV